MIFMKNKVIPVVQQDISVLFDAIKDRLESAPIFSEDEAGNQLLIRNFQMSDISVPVMVVGGTNASGKSVFCSLISSIVKAHGFARREVSMTNRTSTGFERAMIFGDEGDNSTGYNSVSAAMKGIKSSKLSSVPSVLILDEPDIGLSEEYAGAFGEYIASQVLEPDHSLKLIVIVSHSRPLYRRLLAALPCTPHAVFLGSKTQTFMDWLHASPEHYGPEMMEFLIKRGREMRSAIGRAFG